MVCNFLMGLFHLERSMKSFHLLHFAGVSFLMLKRFTDDENAVKIINEHKCSITVRYNQIMVMDFQR